MIDEAKQAYLRAEQSPHGMDKSATSEKLPREMPDGPGASEPKPASIP